MKFTCDRDHIMKGISVAQDIITSRNAHSIMSNVYLETSEDYLIIKATDLKVFFITSIPIDVIESGKTTTVCEKLAGILRTLPVGKIEFAQLGNDHFVITPLVKKIDFRLKTISADKYPETPKITERATLEFPKKELIEMIEHTEFAVSTDTGRFNMNGVLIEKEEDSLVMVATDGKRMAYVKKKSIGELNVVDPIIVHPKILLLIKKLSTTEGAFSISINENHISFEFEKYVITSALINGTFPSYKRIIPENHEYRIEVSREDMIQSLNRVSLMAFKSHRVYFDISTDKLIVFSDVSEIGTAREELSCSYTGTDMKMAFNFQFFLDPLKVIKSKKVAILFTDPTKAIKLESVPQGDFFHILMPLNINE